MLHPHLALARRIERAECRLVVDMAQSVAQRSLSGEVLIAHLGEGAAIFAGANSPLNKWIGLGFDGALDEVRVAELEAEFALRKAAARVELATFADASLAPMLSRRGFVLVGHENVLGLELDGNCVARLQNELRDTPRDISVTKIDHAESRIWLDAVITGFLHPDGSAATPPTESFAREALEQAFSDSIDVPDFDLHLARRGGVVAGGHRCRYLDH